MRYLGGPLVLVLALSAAGQESPADAVFAPQENPEQQVLEELTVSGEKPLGVLREELQDAEDALYAAFNEAIDDPRFEISCDFKRPIGSLIHRRICQPAFVREAEYQATQLALTGVTGASDPGLLEFSANPEAGIALMREEMTQVMADAIEGNPDLMRVFIQYRESQMALNEALGE